MKDYRLSSVSVQPSSISIIKSKNLPKQTYSVSAARMRGALRDRLQKGCCTKCRDCLNLKCQRIAPVIAPAGHQSLLEKS